MAKTRRLKKDYAELFDNPAHLFGRDCEVTLWPNGQPEIWIQNKKTGAGFRIVRAGQGPAGFGMEIEKFAGSAPISVINSLAPDYAVAAQSDCMCLSLCQYNQDERSQAFKRWYADPDNNAHPDKIFGPLPVQPE